MLSFPKRKYRLNIPSERRQNVFKIDHSSVLKNAIMPKLEGPKCNALKAVTFTIKRSTGRMMQTYRAAHPRARS
jgi:hypothetical protein